ncbi:TAXI family TRAP transporter solute-binding subunit [bacterium]|nr:TAXI family TRAP transporter solute-binding subunit [bacterium]
MKWLLIMIVLASVAGWYFTRDVIPRPIRIATGTRSGLNFQLAQNLAQMLSSHNIPAEVRASDGSRENRQLLLSHEADVAMLKAGSVNFDGLEVIAPLCPDVILVVVRRDRHIQQISDLKDRKVVLGLENSGTREVAKLLLQHYRVYDTIRESDRYFAELSKDPSVDAAIVSTAITNPDLSALMKSDQFEILPVEEAGALAMLYPFFQETTVPKGVFLGAPPIPNTNISTVAVPDLLVGTPGSSPKMIDALLSALYDHRLRPQFPTLYPRNDAANWTLTPLHTASRNFHDPYRGLGTAAAFLESLSAIKELFLAFLALGWLGWERYRRVQEVTVREALSQQKERLDLFIDETVRLERLMLASMQDQQALEGLFVQVSQLKLHALTELTHEELRTDQGFTILLAQCRDLVDKILHGMEMLQRKQPRGE